MFAHGEVAAFLEAKYECVWESVRPVPQVAIDFGDGETLKTTLGGNVLSSICLSDGTVVDVMPGVTMPNAFLQFLTTGYRRCRQLQAMEDERRELALARKPRTFGGEDPSDAWLARFIPDGAVPEVALAKAAAFPVDLDLPPALGVTVSKSAIEVPLIGALAARRQGAALYRLERDGEMVASRLQPQARAVLRTCRRRVPEVISPLVFRLVLQIDLDDPHLGLGPDVLGRPGIARTPQDAIELMLRGGA